MKFSSKLFPKILLIIWLTFVLSYLKEADYFSLSIVKPVPSISLGSYRGDALLQGDKVIIEYPSKYKKLGTIGIKFTTYNRINSDTLKFRIKEVGEDSWFYEHDYKVDQFQQFEFFTFGFPILEESSGKTYKIEIESQAGVRDDAVAIMSPLDRSVIAKHVFTRQQLIENPRVLFYFIFHKLLYLGTDIDFLSNLVIYSTPLFFYLIYSLVGSSVGAFSIVIFLSVLADTFYVKDYSGFFFVSVISGWGLMTWHHRIESRVTSSVFLTIFLLSPIFFVFGQTRLGDKAAVWAYLFITSSLIRSVYEIKTGQKNLIKLEDYWHDLVIEGRNMSIFAFLIIVGEIKIAAERIKFGVDITKSEASDLIYKAKLGVNRTNIVSGEQVVALVIYRWETPMVKTYIYTSRFIAYLLILLVKIIGYTIHYGPYALFGWFIWKTLKQVSGYLSFFNDFFVQNQNELFWNHIGNNIVAVYLIVLIIFLYLLFIRRIDLRRKTILAIVILYFCRIIVQSLFNKATPYRDDLTIWSVSPKEITEPWVDVTISGRNFGEMPFAGMVYIDGVEQRIMKWSKKEIIFRTNPLSTSTGNLAVKAYSKAVSNIIKFTYTGNR